MLTVLRSSWPLLLGVMLLMVGNGVQGSLLGIRGTMGGFSTFQISVVMSAYFAGFLLGSQTAPDMIRKVGHIRVFAALGSMISAILVLYPIVPDWIAWSALRVIIGFCFSGIYITAESWLNNAASNDTRGQALSAYMIVQMLGIIASQALLNIPDASGFTLFVIPSVLVSLAFMPMLLAPTPTPTFDSLQALSFRALFRISPLGCVGMLLTGGVYSAMFGMASVWGTMRGLSISQISIFVGSMYVGGLVMQYPVGWLSDRMDRRRLVMWLSVLAAGIMLLSGVAPLPFGLLILSATLLGGIVNPVYSLLIAYTNDFLAKDDMPAASAGMIFLNGFGAIFGPIVTGWMIGLFGPGGFFIFIAVLFAALAGYALYRMSRRASPGVGGHSAFITPQAQSVAANAVIEGQGKP